MTIFGVLSLCGCAYVFQTRTQTIVEIKEAVGPPRIERVRLPTEFRITHVAAPEAMIVLIEAFQHDIEFRRQKHAVVRITKRTLDELLGSEYNLRYIGVRRGRDQSAGLGGYFCLNALQCLPGLGFSFFVVLGDLISLPFRVWDSRDSRVEEIDLSQTPEIHRIEKVQAKLRCGTLVAVFQNNRTKIPFRDLIESHDDWRDEYECLVLDGNRSPLRFTLELTSYSAQSPVIRKYAARRQKQVLERALALLNSYPFPESSEYGNHYIRMNLEDSIRRTASFLLYPKLRSQLEDFTGNQNYEARENKRRLLIESIRKELGRMKSS